MQITFPIYIQGVLTTQTMHAASNKTSKDRNHNFLHHAVNENVHIITNHRKHANQDFHIKYTTQTPFFITIILRMNGLVFMLRRSQG